MAIGDGVSALAELGVTFGGFTPTAIDGVALSKQYVEQLAIADEKRKRAARRKRELELARTSKPKRYDDETGNIWTYVVIDDSVVRITACESTAKKLVIPEMMEGMPVRAIGPDACSRNDYVEEIVCPNSVETIGLCAFRFDSKLRRVVFPEGLTEYSSTWLSHCPKMEEIVLPGSLNAIDLSVFDNPGLRKLYVGPYINEIVPGAFQKTRLESIEIDPNNPFIFTDGNAIYTKDGSALLALARPVEHYRVNDGCVAIGKKAFYDIETLKSVEVPEGVTILGEFAFAHSGLETFKSPSSLDVIGEKAFFYCKQLKSIELNEGLTVIGDSAFEQSALEALHIPASIERIGASMTAATNIIHSGPNCTIEIDEAAPSLFLDSEGGLYRKEDDGVHLVQLIYREAEEYVAWTGVEIVDDYAFAYHSSIRHVTLPDGVRRIGASAFRCSGSLARVDIPDSVEYIGNEAFLDTSLECFRVPVSLDFLGRNALVTQAAHHGDRRPSLHTLEVAEGNEKFYIASGMLCRRNAKSSSVVMFSSSEPHVVIPDEVNRIEDYAFNNARNIEYLELRPDLQAIGTNGLTVWCWIEHIHVETSQPYDDRSSFDFYFPNTSKGIHSISQGIGGASWVNVPGIMVQYDNSIASAHDYNSPRNRDSISIYEQVSKIIARLDDPILLTKTNRNLFERVLSWHIVEICVDIARNDDRYLIDRLLDFGYINEDNLEEIITAVNKLQDAAMTGYLLEAKRLRFNRSAFDFDL